MRAAVVEAPGKLSVRDIPEPDAGPYDAVCEVLYGSTCSGTDLHMINGTYPWPVSYPTVLGHESVGRVVRVGSHVRHFAVGDLVARVRTFSALRGGLSDNWGGFVEIGLARDHRAMREDGLPSESWVEFQANQVVPSDIDPATATMFITWRETLSYSRRLGIASGARVLVIGSGGNGLAFTAHATNLGAEAIVVGNPARASLAERVGAHRYVDYGTHDLAAELARMPQQGFDFIVDAVGRSGQIDRVLEQLNPGGIVGLYGIDDWNQYKISPSKARGTFTFYNGGYEQGETHDAVIEFIRSGKLDARVWLDLDRPYELEQINDAFEAVRRRKLVKALVRL